MSAQSNQTPPDPASPIAGAVRRHHTISAHSRSARAAKEVISEEIQEQQQAIWNDDEVVDQDWVGGVGAVGEKTSLHRQSSLPTRYHRGFHNQASQSGNLTPKTVNSLAAIAGNEGDEEPWKFSAYDVDDDENSPAEHHAQHQQVTDLQAQSQDDQSPLASHFTTPPDAPSPPPAGSGVRRHVSLTYGAAVGGPRKMNSGLKRSGTLQATQPAQPRNASPPDTSEQVEEDEYVYEGEEVSNYDEEYYTRQQQQQQQQQQPQPQQFYNNSVGRSSPWSSNNEWRQGYPNNNNSGNAIDDVQRALSALELASNHNTNQMAPHVAYGSYQQPSQTVHPPRFNPNQGSTSHNQPGGRGNGGHGGYNGNGGNGNKYNGAELDGRKTPLSQPQRGGYPQQQYQGQQRDERNWEQHDQGLRGRASNPNLQYSYQQGHMKSGSASSSGGAPGSSTAVPNVPPIPQQYLQQGNQGRSGLGVATSFSSANPGPALQTGQTPVQPFANTPIDVPSLIATKGYNPATFDTRPQFARYFVIKSYTEDDVHKSLKYEIWSSTDPGNKRLDKAFKDTAGRGPIYLFFSVNASGHFCGMAEMLTPVDYTRSSTVWASDKWKGVFKVRWIFVRDIPNLNLRHIKLNNTQERKPVTNSRDTQELLPDAGQEMLKIFHTHPARTSLLQDFAFYELQAMQKMQATGGAVTPSPPALNSPQLSNSSAPNPNAYPTQQQQPMIQMGMGINGQYGAPQGLHSQTQAMHQSVMRNPSPSPHQPSHQQPNQAGYMGF